MSKASYCLLEQDQISNNASVRRGELAQRQISRELTVARVAGVVFQDESTQRRRHEIVWMLGESSQDNVFVSAV